MNTDRKKDYEKEPWKRAVGDVFRGHPFDTIKVLLQTQPPGQKVYNGALDCVKKTYQSGGFRGFYKGVMSPIAGQMFFNALKFMTYGQAQTVAKKIRKVEKMGPVEYFMAGAAAQAVGATVEGPVDFFKSQVQVQLTKQRTTPGYKPEFTGVFDAFKKITKHNGLIAGSYQGFPITVLRNVLCGATYLTVFETARMWRAEVHGCSVKELPIIETFACGGLSGFSYWVPYYPIDVIKSTMQSDSYIKEQRKFSSYLHAVKKIYAELGIKGFYRGFIPCLARAFPANATLLVTVFHLQNLNIPFCLIDS